MAAILRDRRGAGRERKGAQLPPRAGPPPGPPRARSHCSARTLGTRHRYPYFTDDRTGLKRLSEWSRAHLAMGRCGIQTHSLYSVLYCYHISYSVRLILYSGLTISSHPRFHFLTLIGQQGERHQGSAAKRTEEGAGGKVPYLPDTPPVLQQHTASLRISLHTSSGPQLSITSPPPGLLCLRDSVTTSLPCACQAPPASTKPDLLLLVLFCVEKKKKRALWGPGHCGSVVKAPIQAQKGHEFDSR